VRRLQWRVRSAARTRSSSRGGGGASESAMAPGYRVGARAQDVDMAIHGR
jgi:hypothetical protein